MFKKKFTFSLRVKRWLLFGVFLSVLAVLLSIFYDCMLGYNLSQIKFDCAPDFLLVIFAVAANVMSLATDEEKNITKDKRFDYGCVAGITLLFYIAFYSFGFKKLEGLAPQIVNILLFISVVVFFINVYIGMRIEGNLSDKEEKESEG